MSRPPRPRRPWRKLSPRQRSEVKTRRAQWRSKNPSAEQSDFADECKGLRKRMGLSQEEFARQLEVSSVTVSRWERAAGHLPSKENLEMFRRLETLNPAPSKGKHADE